MMKFYVIKTVYDHHIYGGTHQEFCIIKAKDSDAAIRLADILKSANTAKIPFQNEIVNSGDKSRMKELFFPGTPFYYSSKDKIRKGVL